MYVYVYIYDYGTHLYIYPPGHWLKGVLGPRHCRDRSLSVPPGKGRGSLSFWEPLSVSQVICVIIPGPRGGRLCPRTCSQDLHRHLPTVVQSYRWIANMTFGIADPCAPKQPPWAHVRTAPCERPRAPHTRFGVLPGPS